MTDMRDPFEGLAFDAEGHIVERTQGAEWRTYDAPARMEWVRLDEAAKSTSVCGMVACITQPQGEIHGARVVCEPFVEGGISYVYLADEPTYWAWMLSPAETRTPRPRAQCWRAVNVWVLRSDAVDPVREGEGDMPPDPFL